jgi:hypothetical protein
MPRRSSRYQRAFARWLNVNRSRFLNLPVLRGTNSSKVQIVLENQPACLLVRLKNLEISVIWQGLAWDMLFHTHNSAVRVGSGYRDRMARDHTRLWPCLEAFWIDQMFEPFLAYVNEELAQASTIKLFGNYGEITWAELGNERNLTVNEEPIAEIPLHFRSKQL